MALLTGCDRPQHPAAQPSPPPAAGLPAPPPPLALPAPEVLTDVLYRLADTTVPGTDKVVLVEGASADDAAELERFGKALQDNGYTPVGFTAEEIAWSEYTPGYVRSDITVRSENPALAKGFAFPMEFKAHRGGWQLARQTADMLLTLGDKPPAAPSSSPPP